MSLPTLTCSGWILPVVLEPAEVQRQQLGLAEFDGHVGDLGLSQLVTGQGLVEHLAGADVVQRRLEAVPCCADGAEHDAEPRLRQAASGPESPRAPGSLASSGSRTSSRLNSEVTDARSDILCVISRALKPGRRRGHREPDDALLGAGPDDRRRRRPTRW